MVAEPTTILLVRRRESLHRRLLEMLRNCGLYVLELDTVEQSRSLLRQRSVPLIFCEDRLEDGTYRDLLAAVQATRSAPPCVVVLSRTGEMRDYVEAMQSGAFDFLSPPYEWKQLEDILERASRNRPLSSGPPLPKPRVA